ncbi:hypothetical protein ACLOJK_035355, partial [Asimina triloba]
IQHAARAPYQTGYLRQPSSHGCRLNRTRRRPSDGGSVPTPERRLHEDQAATISVPDRSIGCPNLKSECCRWKTHPLQRRLPLVTNPSTHQISTLAAKISKNSFFFLRSGRKSSSRAARLLYARRKPTLLLTASSSGPTKEGSRCTLLILSLSTSKLIRIVALLTAQIGSRTATIWRNPATHAAMVVRQPSPLSRQQGPSHGRTPQVCSCGLWVCCRGSRRPQAAELLPRVQDGFKIGRRLRVQTCGLRHSNPNK